MSGFNIKRIFQQIMIKTWLNVVFNPKLRKHTFSARSGKNSAKRFFQVTMEQNTLFKKELYSLTGFDAKSHFLKRNGENLGKRGFECTIKQNTLFKKELYAICEFDAKRIF